MKTISDFLLNIGFGGGGGVVRKSRLIIVMPVRPGTLRSLCNQVISHCLYEENNTSLY